MSAIPVYGFFSVKGGVGKSSLAVATAMAYTAQGRPVAVFDLDLTGTSLADGLPLCAPAEGAGGPPQNRSTTLANRFRRKEGASCGLTYLDDILFDDRPFGDPGTLCWRDDSTSIAWFPSSPTKHDVQRAVNVMLSADASVFIHRLQGWVTHVSAWLGATGVLIVDLPPALHGFTDAIVQAMSTSPILADSFRPVLVTTPDRTDLYRSATFFPSLCEWFVGARWVLNRNLEPVEDIRKELEAIAGIDRFDKYHFRRLRSIGWDPDGLGRLFRQDHIDLHPLLLERVLRAVEAR